jgi:hypothetical protein
MLEINICKYSSSKVFLVYTCKYDSPCSSAYIKVEDVKLLYSFFNNINISFEKLSTKDLHINMRRIVLFISNLMTKSNKVLCLSKTIIRYIVGNEACTLSVCSRRLYEK